MSSEAVDGAEEISNPKEPWHPEVVIKFSVAFVVILGLVIVAAVMLDQLLGPGAVKRWAINSALTVIPFSLATWHVTWAVKASLKREFWPSEREKYRNYPKFGVTFSPLFVSLLLLWLSLILISVIGVPSIFEVHLWPVPYTAIAFVAIIGTIPTYSNIKIDIQDRRIADQNSEGSA